MLFDDDEEEEEEEYYDDDNDQNHDNGEINLPQTQQERTGNGFFGLSSSLSLGL